VVNTRSESDLEETSLSDITLREGYVPVVDLALDRPASATRQTALVRAIRQACETSGFLVVVGHAVPNSTVQNLYAAARTFFRQPQVAKAAVLSDPLDPLQHGYTANERMQIFSGTAVGENTGVFGSQPELAALGSANRWPQTPGFRTAFLDYYAAVSGLSLALMRLFAQALDLPANWFDDKFDRHITPLVANYYPPTAGRPATGFRNPAHADFGTLTVLYQDDEAGGLEVLSPDASWRPVPPRPGSFVINLGQLMRRWTNDRWTSTVHRVVHPPADQRHRDRISIGFFYQPNADALISCLPGCDTPDRPPLYPPVRSGDYFLAKSRRAYVERAAKERS
jgi:isopenicillin N synthase-like dioxygenase